MKITPINELENIEEYYKILLYGQSGSGKTTFACDFPKCILVDLEKGRGINYPDLHVTVDSFQELKKFIEMVISSEKFSPYETLIIDSLNEMIEMIIRDVVLGYEAKRPYDDQLTMSDYGKINREVMLFLRNIFDNLSHKMNIIITCGEQPLKYQDEQRQPQMIGNVLPVSIPRLMDFVICTFTEKDNHYLSMANTSRAYAKNRIRISGNNGIAGLTYNHFESKLVGE